jgi:hypothetical protein
MVRELAQAAASRVYPPDNLARLLRLPARALAPVWTPMVEADPHLAPLMNLHAAAELTVAAWVEVEELVPVEVPDTARSLIDVVDTACLALNVPAARAATDSWLGQVWRLCPHTELCRLQRQMSRAAQRPRTLPVRAAVAAEPAEVAPVAEQSPPGQGAGATGAMLPDGPTEDGQFAWKGKPRRIRPIFWRIAKVLWNCCPVKIQHLVEEAWRKEGEEPTDSTVRGRLSEFNGFLDLLTGGGAPRYHLRRGEVVQE